MPKIALPPGVPGIRGLLAAYPDTADALMGLAQAVLRGPSSLSQGERELLAVAVSMENACAYCSQSHAEAARVLLGPESSWADNLLAGNDSHDLPDRLRSLLELARVVARSGRDNAEAVAAARKAGADDRDVHDTVLVASAFSMFNRYVDGLGAPEPADVAAYRPIGARMARDGYL